MKEKQQDKNLQQYRSEIDAIDEKIIKLLQERMAVVANVANLKKSNQEKFFIKSAREADMVKALIQKAEKHIPAVIISEIWRKLITAANLREQKISLIIYNPKDVADYKYLLREYYTQSIEIIEFDSINNVVLELEKNPAQIAAFVVPDEFLSKADCDNWWINLANNKIGLKVFAKIPFIEFTDNKKDQIKLFLAAIKEPEKSKSDSSLLYVELDAKLTKNDLLSALKSANLQGKILKSSQLKQFSGVTFYLLEIAGFYMQEDVEIANLQKSKIHPFVKVIGHFANPLSL